MRKTPPGIHRVPGKVSLQPGAVRPPLWWDIWLGVPMLHGSICIGRTKRLKKHLWHRAFPETGEAPKDIEGWVNAVEWLLEVHRTHEEPPVYVHVETPISTV